jgi:hypothetical protein
LSDALGAPLPEGLKSLTKAQTDQLAAALTTAKARQREALEASTEAALSHIPMLLCGAVRKVLFG